MTRYTKYFTFPHWFRRRVHVNYTFMNFFYRVVQTLCDVIKAPVKNISNIQRTLIEGHVIWLNYSNLYTYWCMTTNIGSVWIAVFGMSSLLARVYHQKYNHTATLTVVSYRLLAVLAISAFATIVLCVSVEYTAHQHSKGHMAPKRVSWR